jgi:Domain of unknown function (DUF4185)
MFASYIQSDFGGDHKNFEAVILEGTDLWHWWRNNGADGRPWQHGQRVSDRAAYPASIIRSSFGSADHGNFEVVAALHGEGSIVELWHLWHDNSDTTHPWSFGQRITEPGRNVTGPASIIQSSFRSGEHGNFEVVVPVMNDDGSSELRHYWHDNSDVQLPWRRGQRVNDPTHRVLGSGCIIQSTLGGSDHGNFEVAGWVQLNDGRSVLHHYWHDNSDVERPWANGQIITDQARGNGVLIQSSFGDTGNFEVVAPVDGRDGRINIQHLWHDNNDVTVPWARGQTISEIGASNASACIFESDFRSGDHGNFEVLFDECEEALVDWWHPNNDVNAPWIRHGCLIADRALREVRTTEKICQLTGETDREGLTTVRNAFNRTESRFGIRGTDLGVSFEHRNRLYFLFGDTWRTNESSDTHFDWDAIAFTTDAHIDSGIRLTFHKQPPLVPGIDQGGFNVPLDGFSYNDQMFAFFSTDHAVYGSAHMMGRSVLAVSDNDGYDFVPRLTFSSKKFINVSVELGQLNQRQAETIGWATGTEVLWIWGSGSYRASPAYLAVANVAHLTELNSSDLSQLAKLDPNGNSIRYLAANSQQPLWSVHEHEAVPLFCAGDIGELSCRYNTMFDRYFLTYNSGSPRGIVLRHAPQPWGPWSGPIVIFFPGWGATPTNPIGAGYGTFMHVDWRTGRVDHVQDDMFLSGPRDNEWAGEYGPYQIPRFTTGEPGNFCDLNYTMSTWNPYQSMLMRTRITAADLH